jgi:hypothetical protein
MTAGGSTDPMSGASKNLEHASLKQIRWGSAPKPHDAWFGNERCRHLCDNSDSVLNVVAKFTPSKSTAALFLKFAPLTKISKSDPPAIAFAGEIDVMTVAGGTTSNVIAFDCFPSLFRTMTARPPVAAINEAGTIALRSKALINEVEIDVPSINTVAPGAKFKPVKNNVNVPLPTITTRGNRPHDRSRRDDCQDRRVRTVPAFIANVNGMVPLAAVTFTGTRTTS